MKMKKMGRLSTLMLLGLSLLMNVSGIAQAVSKVEGVVSNESGEPLKSATIVYTNLSTNQQKKISTEESGKFTLIDLEIGKKYSVDFSFVGYESYHIASLVIKRDDINKLVIRMKEASKGLDEVVVIGYGKLKKRDVTGAVSSVKSDKIAEFPAANLTNALQGRVAGVMVQTTSWRPGTSGTIRIRGSRSINASNEPLYVVDGIPTVDAIDQLSTNDIESIEVLKDASATAIYGNRGANGVIIITTKRGQKGKTTIDFNNYYGIQTNRKLPELMDAAAFVEYSREAQRNVL